MNETWFPRTVRAGQVQDNGSKWLRAPAEPFLAQHPSHKGKRHIGLLDVALLVARQRVGSWAIRGSNPRPRACEARALTS
jgi:hypothetical protein